MVILGVFSFLDLRVQEEQITEEDKIKASLVTEIIKNGLIAMMLEGRSGELLNFIETLVADDLGAIRLYTPKGNIIASSVPSDTGGFITNEDDLSGQFEPKLAIRTERGRPVYNIKIPFYNEKPCQTCHTGGGDILSILSVSVTMDKTLKRIRDMRARSVVFFLFTLAALSAGLGLLTTILVNRPINSIINTMKKVEGGEVGARVTAKRGDEIGNLGVNLNSMLSELGKMRQELESCHVEAMQKVEKMATIGELAAAIAHEIKNPLAGISGAIQVFEEEFPPGDPRRDIIAEVQNEIQRLDKAVRDLLRYAKPPNLHPTKTPIDSLVERSVGLVMGQARKQNVNVNILTVDNPVEVNVDVEQIQQVFLNVMLNALHSMPAGGDLNIASHVRPEKAEAEISFADTGPGISRENLNNIFKPFFTTKHTGTGLGLAISKKIMENHGGDILVESEVGTGSNFRLILPLEEENA
jgi:signal transduction histidine kinase